ncbi:MAG: type III secretion system effector protein [Actinobacteria bacterium]|nr:type III secretion system effector protein [Actinomycetota bacterium]
MDHDELTIEEQFELQQKQQRSIDFLMGTAQEGPAGLADYEGMLDRQAAQRELESRFVVLGEGEAAAEDAAPNVVTEEEYREIARTFSDIRLGRSDIAIDASAFGDDAASYEAAIMDDLADILQTESGRELVNSLAYHPVDDHLTMIAGSPDNTQAIGGEYGGHHGHDGEAAKRVFALYSPGWGGGVVEPDAGPDGEDVTHGRSDVVLFHELVHAHHAAYGTAEEGVIDPIDVFRGDGEVADALNLVSDEEYQVTGLGEFAGDLLTENTYREERARIGAADIGEREDEEGVENLDDDHMPTRKVYSAYGRAGH